MAESHGNAKGATAHTEADGGHKAPFPPFQKDTFASQLVSLLVAFLQAYVFTILTCIYINDAIHPGH